MPGSYDEIVFVNRRRILLLVLLSFTLSSAISSTSARAMDRDVRAILTTSEYGLLGGVVLGLASYPFTKKPRGIAIGASVGL